MKSQNAIEFTVVLGIAIVFFLVVSLLITSRTVDIQTDRSALYAQNIAESIQQEIDVAKQVQDGYTRGFTIDSEYGGQSYNVSLFGGREIRIMGENGISAVKFLPQYIVGNVSVGYNEIMKRSGMLAFCAGGCNGTFPVDFSGSFLCSPQQGLWTVCNPSYDDAYEGIRIKCFQSGVANASLLIEHADTSYVALNSTTALTYEDFMYFDEDFEISRSGVWDVTLVCYDALGVPYPPYSVAWNIPYGHLVAIYSGLSGNSACTDDKCIADENFYPSYTISCVGGDCGNVSALLDPEEQ